MLDVVVLLREVLIQIGERLELVLVVLLHARLLGVKGVDKGFDLVLEELDGVPQLLILVLVLPDLVVVLLNPLLLNEINME